MASSTWRRAPRLLHQANPIAREVPLISLTRARHLPFAQSSRLVYPFSTSSLSRSNLGTPPPPPSDPSKPPEIDPKFDAPLQGTATSARKAKGPNNAIALALFLITGVGLFYYFTEEKRKVEEKKKSEMGSKSVGRVRVGGPFELVEVGSGEKFTEKDMMGKFSLIYFGFTNCPDICPEELDKMSIVVDRLTKEFGEDSILPIFVSVDPGRDTPDAVKKYLVDFHPKMIGLTGTYEAVKQTCKTYRVYFSTPPNKKPGEDYLVDHSIFFYLMSPNGYFVDAFGKIFTKEEVFDKCQNYMTEWKQGRKLGEEDEVL